MRLSKLLADLPDVIVFTGAANPIITQIAADSRQVIPGALFVAYRGIGIDSHRYIPDALSRGAVAIVGELSPLPDLTAPYVQVADGRAAWAWLSAAWRHHPSRSMAVVGITGTDGKTTTASVLYSILQAAGRRVGLISTVNAVIGNVVYDTGLHTTTPDAPDVQRYLAQMLAAGTEIAVLETTSHGLAQHRVTGCAFDVAVVTNVTHEHLDFHGSYAAYREAKALLFRSLSEHRPDSSAKPGFSGLRKTAVLNRDDRSFDYLSSIPAEWTVTYGLGQAEDLTSCGGGLHLTAVNIRHTHAGTEFDIIATGAPPPVEHAAASPCLTTSLSSFHLITPLIGDFNIYNVLAAAGAALALGTDRSAIKAGVAAVRGVSGRMERIDHGQPFTALVDFAHTPNALARALETVRDLAGPSGRIIAVFGSAGLRDRTKRRLMGSEAAQYADFTIITAEDPRTEALTDIMAETAQAMATAGRIEGQDFVQIADRQRAILHAVQQARPGDVVIVCGKGHEQSMCFGTVEYPWRDQDALAWALDQRLGRGTSDPPHVLPTWSA